MEDSHCGCRGLKKIRNFSPIWFSINMATGIVSSLFRDYPFGGDHSKTLNIFALTFYFLNLFLFTLFLSCTIARYTLYPNTWRSILHDPVEGSYWGCFPMAGATIISASLTLVHQYWGFGDARYLYVLWGLWWLDCVISFVCAFGIIYIMSAYHSVSISSLTPRWLLPVMTLIVASTTGQQLAGALIPISPRNAFITISISLLMLSIGLILAFMILTLWICRLLIYGFPDAMAVPSAFLPLGPCGQSGYSLLLAGQNFDAILATNGSGAIFGDPLMGRILNGISFSFAFTFWSLELWWLLSAVITLLHFKIRGIRIPFNLSTWALVFPNGVYALLTLQLADSIDTIVLKIFGAIQIIIVIIIWTVLAIQTLVHVVDGSIFQPADEPSLQNRKEFTRTSSLESRAMREVF